MLFHEIHGAYYNAVAGILAEATRGALTPARMRELIDRHAFSESSMTILPALKSGRWPLLDADLKTPLRHAPTMPPGLLERRWLKAILSDPRIRLFGVDIPGLEDVQPLFTDKDFCVYDRYSDGDDFTDEAYIRRFRTALQAVRTRQPLSVDMLNRYGQPTSVLILPERLEYSEKDDKFRLTGRGPHASISVNLSRIRSIEPAATFEPASVKIQEETAVIEIEDVRSALERSLLHFAHFKNRVEQLDGMHYRIHISYDPSDETELVIRILSFGPYLRVTEPARLVSQIRERLRRQAELLHL